MIIYLNESLFKKKEKAKKKYQALTKKEGNEIFNYIKQILHKFPLFEKECNLKDYGKSKDNQNYSFSGEVDDDQYLILFSYPNKKSIPQDGDFYDYIFNKINNINTKPEPPNIDFYITTKSETDKAYIVALSRKNIESTNESSIYLEDGKYFNTLNESSYLHKLILLKYCKPRQDLAVSFKKHEYPGYLNMIDHLKDLDDIAYIRQDIRLGLADADRIGERLELCQNGENKENKKYYKGIKKLYIDKGITKSDVEANKNWLNTVAKEKLNSKAKELREKEKIKESAEVTNEAFGLSKKEKDRTKSLRELELEYDRKFNAFFLHVGGYSVDKLETTLSNKQNELKSVQDELKHTSRQDKYALKIKEDYLKNICNRCKELIKKKKQIEK